MLKTAVAAGLGAWLPARAPIAGLPVLRELDNLQNPSSDRLDTVRAVIEVLKART